MLEDRMNQRKSPKKNGRLDEIVAEAKRNQELRTAGYRDRALKLFPHVCGRCGREFSGKGLRDLTVHHKDHNHENNPLDGSNWELLCVYCHDKEHGRYSEGAHDEETAAESGADASYRPFAALKDLLNQKKNS
jgi:5-methylcytosine-specific restriction endonuclease McrA